MNKHRVNIHLEYLFGTIPYKWRGMCMADGCQWMCLSWSWQREDGSGALLMANEHYTENHGKSA